MTDTERAEYDDVVRQLMAKCEQLAAENTRLRSSENNAHNVLKEIYNDPAASPSVRVKAAGLALPHETPRLIPQPPPMDLIAEPAPILLADLVRRRRARQAALEGLPPGDPKRLEWVNRDVSDYSPPTGQRNGNGSDDGSGGDHS
jgi:hypothetical protein